MTSRNSLSQNPEEKFLRNLLEGAGSLTLQYFRKNLRQFHKPDSQGIVTEADLATESYIISTIKDAYPESQFIAEESLPADSWGPEGLSTAARQALANDLVWIIDPIDGTTNFAKGNPYYCVSVAVGRMAADGSFETLLGGVHQPITGELFLGVLGKGAYLNGERLPLLGPATMSNACFATGFGYQSGMMIDQVLRTAAALKNESLGLRINGAAALDIAWTACGRSDGFYEIRLMPWDMAAAALIAREAGLVVRNMKGTNHSVLDDGNIIVSHPDLFEGFFDIIQGHRETLPPPKDSSTLPKQGK
jgi:myo-inositol-1(or 4)-monophosphatase